MRDRILSSHLWAREDSEDREGPKFFELVYILGTPQS